MAEQKTRTRQTRPKEWGKELWVKGRGMMGSLGEMQLRGPGGERVGGCQQTDAEEMTRMSCLM